MSERENDEQKLAYLKGGPLKDGGVLVECVLEGRVGYKVDSAAMLIRIWDDTGRTWQLHTPNIQEFVFNGAQRRE
jgi:hypothetical protein